MPDTNVAIAAQGVSKIFKGADQDAVVALDNISLDIAQNEFFTLLGPSGCGKTTLLRLIAGFEFPTSGHIYLYDEDIALLPAYKRPVNTVFQNYALFPHMTVAQNIGFGLEMLGKPKPEIDARVSEMLKLVRMEDLSARKTSQISGGQQQRVALARALAPRPKVLLLDEPLSALDYKLRKDMQIELKRLQTETGITFIFVTHDQEEALTMSDRIAVMSKGKVLQVGSPHDIYDHPADRFVANFIGETNFLKGEVTSSAKNLPQVKLDAGPVISAAAPVGIKPSGKVTVVLRPEQTRLAAAGHGELQGVIENIVFFGTDTHFYVKLNDGSIFMTRQQNSRSHADSPRQGDKVDIQLAENAARILKD